MNNGRENGQTNALKFIVSVLLQKKSCGQEKVSYFYFNCY